MQISILVFFCYILQLIIQRIQFFELLKYRICNVALFQKRSKICGIHKIPPIKMKLIM